MVVMPLLSPQNQICLEELELDEKRLALERERLRSRLEMQNLEMGFTTDPVAFDVVRNIKLVPSFSDTDAERFFPHFERVATNLKWPKSKWAVLLQCVLIGRAQEIYASLPIDHCGDYDFVKSSILRGYQLPPEAYRLKFRSLRKKHDQTFVQLSWFKTTSFDRRCTALNIDSMDKMREFILVEEFINCLSPSIAIHVRERKPTTIHAARILADGYVLFHNRSRHSTPASTVMKMPNRSRPVHNEKRACFYCHNPGHIISDCLKLKRKQSRGEVVAEPSVPDVQARNSNKRSRVCPTYKGPCLHAKSSASRRVGNYSPPLDARPP